MKLLFDYEVVDMGNEIVAVPVGRNAGIVPGVLKLNGTGMEVMELIKDGKDVEEIKSIVSSRYENDSEEIREYIDSFIQKLSDLGLLEI